MRRLCAEKELEWEETVFAEGIVYFDNGTQAHCVETLLPYKYLSLKKPSMEIQVKEENEAYVLQIQSDVFTPFTELDFDDADVIFSDNYFHLTGDLYEVRIKKEDIKNGSFCDASDVHSRIRVRSLIDTYD